MTSFPCSGADAPMASCSGADAPMASCSAADAPMASCSAAKTLMDDRRRRRSHDPLVALHYQLSETRRQGALETVVVADGSGMVVAGAGSWAACEELAAFAPLLGDARGGGMEGFERVTVRTLDVGGDRILLCARSSDTPSDEEATAREVAMKQAALGVSRILLEAA